MTEIDPRPRQLLRDYARQPLNLVKMNETNTRIEVTTGHLGEVAGPVFEALQGVLTLAENRQMIAAEEIFAAVRKPFER